MAALPKTLGGLEARYIALEQEIQDFKRRAKALEAQQDEVLEAVAKMCAAQRIEAHRGSRYTFAYVEKDYAQIEDWPRFLRHAVEAQEYDLVTKRPALGACRERWDQGETIPGVVRQSEREFAARALPGKAV